MSGSVVSWLYYQDIKPGVYSWFGSVVPGSGATIETVTQTTKIGPKIGNKDGAIIPPQNAKNAPKLAKL